MPIGEPMTVLCVDDNPHVAEALRVKLARAFDMQWQGWLSSADELVATAERQCPTIVLLDVDMPGKDPFAALGELVERCPAVKVVVFSGHVRQELIDRALEAGAWGYVSKNDGEDELLRVIRAVADGEVALSPEVRSTYD
ncbi:MAG: response regulator transcription factor, partial [Phycisphaerales bacterium]|nr:response regulator transcription factor [Phycisphaerales bacterium]